MKSSVNIREYKPTDRKHLVRLQEEIQDYFVSLDRFGIFRRQPEYGRLYTNYCLRAVRKHQGKVYVAMDGETMVGFVIGAIHDKGRLELSFYKPIKTGFVYMLYVQPKYQGQKIGKALMDKMEGYFKQKGCHIVRLDAVGSHEKPYGYYKKRKYAAWGVDMIKVLKKV